MEIVGIINPFCHDEDDLELVVSKKNGEYSDVTLPATCVGKPLNRSGANRSEAKRGKRPAESIFDDDEVVEDDNPPPPKKKCKANETPDEIKVFATGVVAGVLLSNCLIS